MSPQSQAIGSDLKALILAGGKGTRLRPLTYAMAKQLVPVANKPILHYALDGLYQGGIRDFGIIISPETGEAIKESLETWQKHLAEDVKLTFILQDEPAGLAHAVKIAEPYLGKSPFVMYLGDNLINADLKTLIQAFMDRVKNEGFEASIMLKQVPNPSSFGVAELDAQGHVVRLVEKPKEPKSDLAMIGVYMFTASIFTAISRIQPSWRGELEITDAIQQLIDDKGKVFSSIHPGWWLDTGKKDDLLAANEIVLNEYFTKQIDGDIDAATSVHGDVTIGAGSVVKSSRLTGPIVIGTDCCIENAVIGPNTSIGDGSTLVDCEVQNSVFLENCHITGIRGAIEDSLLGKGCRISQAPGSHQFLLADHSEIQVL